MAFFRNLLLKKKQIRTLSLSFDFLVKVFVDQKNQQFYISMFKGIVSIQDSKLQRQKLEDFQCQICFSIALKPVQCIGPCRKKFCARCVSDWKKQQNKCPLKCSQPFYVRLAKPPQALFKCPYDQNRCPIILKSIKEFEQHFLHCQYISEKQRHFENLKIEYKCFNEHTLQFFLGTYEEICQSTCRSCEEVKLCRSICRKCNELYCVQCRPPLFSKKGCPLGHRFNHQHWKEFGYFCEICGICATIKNQSIYDDPLCNSGVCQQCYNNLPEEKNCSFQCKNPYMCNKNHELRTCFPQKEKKQCRNCQKIKYCPKICEECSQQFCLQCKKGIMTQYRQCYFGHKLKYRAIQVNQKGQECVKCQKQVNQFFFDPVCQFALCQTCFIYEYRLIDNQSRFIEEQLCKNGHLLKFNANDEDHYNKCDGCGRNKIIKLFGDCCPPERQLYCCQCRPLKNMKLCYFGHGLKEKVLDWKMACNKCQFHYQKVRQCSICYYFICQKCYDPKNNVQEQGQGIQMTENQN